MTAKKSTPFAKFFAELEAITAWFERDTADLEEGLEKFERGMAIAKELRERLDAAEVKIRKIQETSGTTEESE